MDMIILDLHRIYLKPVPFGYFRREGMKRKLNWFDFALRKNLGYRAEKKK
jgi:hypothetical protein